MFIYNSLLYAYNNPDKVRFKVFYIPREETPEDVLHRFMCYILYKLSKGKVIVDRNDLKSSKNVALDEKVLELLNSEEYKSILDFFEENVMFYPSVNPSGVWKEMIKYAEDHGKVYKRKIETKDEFGCEKEIELTLKDECPKCKGTGCKPGTSKPACGKCGGKGQIVFTQQSLFGGAGE